MDRDYRLVVDQGNSHTKVAVMQGDEVVDFAHFDSCGVEEIVGLIADRKVRGVIVCSVVGTDVRLVETLRMLSDGDVIVLTNETPLPVKIAYSTPRTLGHDRIADAAGAAALFPGESILVADAGSALTLDVVSTDGVFIGGNISPGLSMRFRALEEFTRCLPRVTYREGKIPCFGQTTDEAIRAGVVRGIAAEISAAAADARRLYGCSRLVLTGGHAAFLSRFIDADEMNLSCEPHLLVKGLNRILIHNETI